MEIIIIRVPDTQKYEKLGYSVIRIDRQSPVGNPFYMHNESERNAVCDQYQEYFNNNIANKNRCPEFMEYLRDIYKKAQVTKVALACWCAPKRCHGETIKKFIESFNKEEHHG